MDHSVLELYSPTTAAENAGVCRQTLAAWLRAGLIRPRFVWSNKLSAQPTPLFSREEVELIKALRKERAARMRALHLRGRPLKA
jgi:predicted site-specific integrase-resolvase